MPNHASNNLLRWPQFAHIPSSSLLGEHRDRCILDISWWCMWGGGEKIRPFTVSAWKSCFNLSSHQLLLVELQPAQLMPLFLRQSKHQPDSTTRSHLRLQTHIHRQCFLQDLGPLVLLFLAFIGHVSTIFLWKQEYSLRSVEESLETSLEFYGNWCLCGSAELPGDMQSTATYFLLPFISSDLTRVLVQRH